MHFILFILCLWTAGMFHRWEHHRFIAELRRLHGTLRPLAGDKPALKKTLASEDWRATGLPPGRMVLKRAFNVRTRADALRYGVPVALVAVLLVGMQAWALGAAYGALIALRWFGGVVDLNLSAQDARYDVRVFGLRLFGEYLS